MNGSRADRERLEQFAKVWTELIEAAREHEAVILVEGEKDKRCLERLGIHSSVTLVHQGQRLPAIAQRAASGHVRAIVLTDWDRKGGQLADRLAGLLEGMDLRVDLEVRQRLARVVRGELVHVEGLYRWALHLTESVGLNLATLVDEWRLAGAADSTG